MTKRRRPDLDPPSLDPPRLGPIKPRAAAPPLAPEETRLGDDASDPSLDTVLPAPSHDEATMPRIARSRSRKAPPPPGDYAAAPVETPKRRKKKRPDVPVASAAHADTRLAYGDEAPRGRGLKIALWSVLGLAGLAATAVAALLVFLPTDLIRDRLVQEVKARTGRDLTIAGETSVSLWPRLALSAGKVSLSNADGAGGGSLLTADSIEAAAAVWPLLSREVVIEHLVLKRPVIDLVVDRNGRRNWDFAEAGWPARRYAQAATTDARPLPKELEDFVKGATPAEKAPAKASRPRGLALEDVRLADGTIRYRDQRSGLAEELRAVNLTATLSDLAKPLSTNATFQWRGEPVALEGTLAPFAAVLDKKPVQVNLTVTASPLAAQAVGVANFSGDLEFEGSLKAKAASVERLASWSGRPLPVSVPGALDLSTRLKIAGPVAAFADTSVALDRIGATGALTVDGRGARPHVKGAIRFAELDLNAITAIAGTAQPAAASSPASPVPAPPVAAPITAPSAQPQSIEDLLKSPPPTTGRTPQVRGYTRRAGWSDDAIDLSGLGLVDADLKINFQRLRHKDLVTGQGQVTAALKNRAARVTLDELALYDGTARGVLTVDATQPGTAAVGTNVVAEGVSILPMLKGLNGFDWLQGRARVAVAVAGQGATERQIVSTLNGKAELTMGDGALVGLNIPQILRNLMQGKLGNFDRNPAEKTDFTEFAATAQITNGIVRNQDLRMTSPAVRVTGAGTVNLPAETLDYVLKPKITGNLGTTAVNLTGLEVPLKLTGKLDKPNVQPDIAGLQGNAAQAVQAVQEFAKTPAGQEVQNTVKGLLAGDEAAKAKAKGLLDQLIKR